MSFRTLLLLLISLLPITAMAEESSATIQQVQGLVVVYGKVGIQPARVGMPLYAGDEVRTGRSGKVYIDFSDNSRVKLGSRSEFRIRHLDADQGLFSASLDFFKGAFRYTAGKLSKWRARSTKVYTRTAVLGVRGTDFWGRSERESTFFLLLEGEVSLAPRFGVPTSYSEVGKAVTIDSSGISAPELLSREAVNALASETEIN